MTLVKGHYCLTETFFTRNIFYLTLLIYKPIILDFIIDFIYYSVKFYYDWWNSFLFHFVQFPFLFYFFVYMLLYLWGLRIIFELKLPKSEKFEMLINVSNSKKKNLDNKIHKFHININWNGLWSISRRQLQWTSWRRTRTRAQLQKSQQERWIGGQILRKQAIRRIGNFWNLFRTPPYSKLNSKTKNNSWP